MQSIRRPDVTAVRTVVIRSMNLEWWVRLRAESVRQGLTVPQMLVIILSDWFAAQEREPDRLAS